MVDAAAVGTIAVVVPRNRVRRLPAELDAPTVRGGRNPPVSAAVRMVEEQPAGLIQRSSGRMNEAPSAKGKPGARAASTTGWARATSLSTSSPCSAPAPVRSEA